MLGRKRQKPGRARVGDTARSARRGEGSMTEDDLNDALHDVMVRSSPPPSMDPQGALQQARRVRQRRRASWAGLAVVPLVAGVVAAPSLLSHLNETRSVGGMVAGDTST